MSNSIKVKAAYHFFGQALISVLIFVWLALVPKTMALVGLLGVVLMVSTFVAYWAIHRCRVDVTHGWNTMATFFDLFCLVGIFTLGLLGFVLWLEHDGLSTQNTLLLGFGILVFLVLPPLVTASLSKVAQAAKK